MVRGMWEMKSPSRCPDEREGEGDGEISVDVVLLLSLLPAAAVEEYLRSR